MADRLSWTEAALGDVDEIAAFIARDSPTHAAIVVSKITSTCESLLGLTVLPTAVPEIDLLDVRQVHVYNYRIILRMTSTDITVLAVFHGARDIARTISSRL